MTPFLLGPSFLSVGRKDLSLEVSLPHFPWGSGTVMRTERIDSLEVCIAAMCVVHLCLSVSLFLYAPTMLLEACNDIGCLWGMFVCFFWLFWNEDGVLDESEQEAFEEIHNERSSLDHQLVRFLKRCSSPASSRGHVLRYALGGSPLWPFSTNQLTTEPPACERCGAARQFECQVQPQLLFELRKFFEKRAQPLASDRKEKEEVVKEKKNKTKNEGEERGGEDRTLAGRDDNEEEASGDRRGAEENNRNVNGQEAKEGGGGGKGKKKEKTNEGGGAGEAKRDEKRQAIGGGKEVRKDPGTVAREEAAEVASERLHFALLCLYTCSAHCSGQGKVQEDSIEDEEEKVGNHRGRRKNQEKSEKSSYSRDDGRLVYPYTIEYVYVQPDPFYASAKEKKNQTTKERN